MLLKSINFTWYDSFKYILSIIGTSILIYKFIRGLSRELGLLSLINSFIISFAIPNFVLDHFTYSKFKYLRVIQRF